MHQLKRSALVPYSDRQMFELVNHIEDYPRFLPWCSASKVISRTDEEVTAELEIVWKGIHKTFATRNKLFPYHRMDIILDNGPLQHMEGVWDFQALDEKACKVVLDLQFAFTGSFIDRLFQPIFEHIATTMVDAFCKRAAELYGTES